MPTHHRHEEDRDMASTDTAGVAENYAQTLRELEDGYVEEERYPSASEAVDAWASTSVLDITYRLSINGGGPGGVRMLVGFGGPDVWLACLGNGTVRVEVSWWGDSASLEVDAPTVDAWAWSVVEDQIIARVS